MARNDAQWIQLQNWDNPEGIYNGPKSVWIYYGDNLLGFTVGQICLGFTVGQDGIL